VFWWLAPVYPQVKGKVFTTFHGWEGQYPVRWQAKLQRLLYNKLSRGVIHVGEWIQEFYWDRPHAVTYGGISIPVSEGGVKSQALGPSPRLRAVFIGRLVSENDVELYIELVKQLKQRGVDIQMQWVGDGPLSSRAAEEGEVVGWQSRTEAAIPRNFSGSRGFNYGR
jgi:glycosyltransferase involved in cell wall biosynthesis